jgi:hypothetical protein
MILQSVFKWQLSGFEQLLFENKTVNTAQKKRQKPLLIPEIICILQERTLVKVNCLGMLCNPIPVLKAYPVFCLFFRLLKKRTV